MTYYGNFYDTRTLVKELISNLIYLGELGLNYELSQAIYLSHISYWYTRKIHYIHRSVLPLKTIRKSIYISIFLQVRKSIVSSLGMSWMLLFPKIISMKKGLLSTCKHKVRRKPHIHFLESHGKQVIKYSNKFGCKIWRNGLEDEIIMLVLWCINRFLSEWIIFIMSILCGGLSFTHYTTYVVQNPKMIFFSTWANCILPMCAKSPSLWPLFASLDSYNLAHILFNMWDRS